MSIPSTITVYAIISSAVCELIHIITKSTFSELTPQAHELTVNHTYNAMWESCFCTASSSSCCPWRFWTALSASSLDDGWWGADVTCRTLLWLKVSWNSALVNAVPGPAHWSAVRETGQCSWLDQVALVIRAHWWALGHLWVPWFYLAHREETITRDVIPKILY